jgi:hypothetical protein
VHETTPLRSGHPRPRAVGRLLRRVDGRSDVGARRVGDGREDVARVRIRGVKTAVALGVQLLAADEHLVSRHSAPSHRIGPNRFGPNRSTSVGTKRSTGCPRLAPPEHQAEQAAVRCRGGHEPVLRQPAEGRKRPFWNGGGPPRRTRNGAPPRLGSRQSEANGTVLRHPISATAAEKPLSHQGPRKLPKLDVAGSTPVARSRERAAFSRPSAAQREARGRRANLGAGDPKVERP